ncbi:MAG: XRE family transcriptional regulator [Candidatus Omnitrophota bacterium]|jgi:transcriptional regulator with XRE-family HTH domain|nr:MAG: XRE family transcriptional regulator [Candidatus Omnitrophota bacterium]
MKFNKLLHRDVTISERIGIALQMLREQKGLTQKTLAEQTGVKQAMISLIENGKRNTKINIESLHSLASVLHPQGLTGIFALAEHVPEVDEVIDKTRKLISELRNLH